MQLNTLISSLLLLLSVAPYTNAINLRSGSATVPKDAILLSKVKTLTLRANAQTSHRRVPAVPQLTCKGPGCAYYKVDIMRCINAGSGYGDEDIEWSCTASLPEEFKLGSTDVACEGYSSRDDPYVLKGSCGVEYRLLFTSKGEEKYGKPGWGGGSSTEWNWGSVIFVIIFVGVLGWIIYSACTAARVVAPVPNPRRPGFFGGGWNPGAGGGGPGGPPGGPPGDPFDPPPPYPGSKPYGSGSQQQGWRPGFWSGAGVGAGLGYMAGNRGREREPLFGQPQRGNNNGWFGGGNSNNHQGHFQPPRSDSNGSSSSARHESTGFGSTSRR